MNNYAETITTQSFIKQLRMAQAEQRIHYKALLYKRTSLGPTPRIRNGTRMIKEPTPTMQDLNRKIRESWAKLREGKEHIKSCKVRK